MAKKTFTGGLESLIGEYNDKNKVGRPRTQFKEIKKSSEVGTIEGETRATFIVRESLLEKVKAVAYWDRLKMKDVINIALEEYLSRYEKESGEIKPKPNK
jgi:hypothetical protein